MTAIPARAADGKGARRISLDPTLNTRLAQPWAEMWQKVVFGGSKGWTFCRNMVYSSHCIGTEYLPGGSGGLSPRKILENGT